MPTWKRSNPKHKDFNCSFAWHYRKSGLYLAVYYLLDTVTSGGKNPFFSSRECVAKYFDANYETVRRVFKQLIRHGWLKRDPLNPRNLWLVKHGSEPDNISGTWIETHKDQCCIREKVVWEDEADPFVGKLYAIAAGKFRLYENHAMAIRKHGSDEEILELFRKEIAAAADRKARGVWEKTSPIQCFWTVYKHLREQTATRKRQEKANQNDQASQNPW